MSAYAIKNMLLTHPADWFVERETLALAKASLPLITEFYKGLGVGELGDLPLRQIIREPLREVYTVPLFSDKFCALLMDEIENMKARIDFTPNTDEDEDALRQIPEIVLGDQAPEIYNSLMEIVSRVVNPVLLTIWNRVVEGGNIQIANYNLKGQKQGAWHHDASSDITIVVPLNTGGYTGGGTEFANRGVVEPLPTGHALIFPGLTHMHRGLAVQEGDRYLLVFWLKCEKD